ncbi:MAG: ribosomal L7Ae/L30e/S12e/Gadd45 family protein [Clostridiales bacterium]|nr:ribosomal L7Ae/L30e/S12e/Gadd45 family protein [Clostridiales bacterium]
MDAIEKKIAGYAGIAQKAGKLAAGDRMVLQAVKSGKAFLVIMAVDIAQSAREELLQAMEGRGIPLFRWQDKASLGLMTGKSPRGALALLDKGFADAIEESFGKIGVPPTS